MHIQDGFKKHNIKFRSLELMILSRRSAWMEMFPFCFVCAAEAVRRQEMEIISNNHVNLLQKQVNSDLKDLKMCKVKSYRLKPADQKHHVQVLLSNIWIRNI